MKKRRREEKRTRPERESGSGREKNGEEDGAEARVLEGRRRWWVKKGKIDKLSAVSSRQNYSSFLLWGSLPLATDGDGWSHRVWYVIKTLRPSTV